MNGGPDQLDSSQRGSPVLGQMARRSRALTHLKPLARAGQPWAFSIQDQVIADNLSGTFRLSLKSRTQTRGGEKLEMHIECTDQDTCVLLLHC
jgi:hypothetical protein